MKNSRPARSTNKQNHYAQCSVEEIDFDQQRNRQREDSTFLHFASNTIIYVSEATMTALLSPYFLWQWFTKHNYCLELLKIVFQVLCAVATSRGFAIGEKKNLASGAVNKISSLKESAVHKTEGIIETVKDAAKSKVGYLVGIKDAKISAAKNTVISKYSQLPELKPAKLAFAQNLIAFKTAQLSKAYSAISSKAESLHQYKLNLKDKAVSVVSDAASKVYSAINKKKELIHLTKKPEIPDQEFELQPEVQKQPILSTEKPEIPEPVSVSQPDVQEQPILSTEKPETPDQVLFLQSNVPREPINVQTYVSYEPAVVGKVFVPEIPVQIYEEPQVLYGQPLLYGPPADTYGPPIIPL